MPKVELTLSSFEDITFKVTKTVDFDDQDWEEMSREERQALVDEEGQQFLNDNVEWDYKVLS